MKNGTRKFRTEESLAVEEQSRAAIAPFLESRGFKVQRDQRKRTGTAQSQVITAIDHNGKPLRMRVRLCWRSKGGEKQTSAAQLRARLVDGDWSKTLDAIVERDKVAKISHALLVQRIGDEFKFAALIPAQELKSIWFRQREVSDELIAAGKTGANKKNHATNGNSPTIWLMDSRSPSAHAVADVLWNWPGVLNVVNLPAIAAISNAPVDDTYEDIAVVDVSSFGSDGAAKVKIVRSQVKRDARVRENVIQRATSGCERESCGDTRRYPGFLDVHHILGAETSDRVWNCVALCPNCHREAHFSPVRDQLNEELLLFAMKFKG